MILCFLFKMKIATLAFMKSCSTVRLIIRTIYLSANWAKQCLLTTLKRFINKNLLASIGDGQLDYLYSRDGGAQRVLHARIAYDCGHSTNPRTHLPLGTLRSHWYIYFFLHLYTIRVAFTLLRCWCWFGMRRSWLAQARWQSRRSWHLRSTRATSTSGCRRASRSTLSPSCPPSGSSNCATTPTSSNMPSNGANGPRGPTLYISICVYEYCTCMYLSM